MAVAVIYFAMLLNFNAVIRDIIPVTVSRLRDVTDVILVITIRSLDSAFKDSYFTKYDVNFNIYAFLEDNFNT